ncbi:kinesin light chain-like protein [hydrothermal vent metagenome]|uniref:Nephrocystin-3 n=1 Tax=hydrothermal vent metagenome TaxID=652676 RepID=A0A1W1BW70_9ZZZZ
MDSPQYSWVKEYIGKSVTELEIISAIEREKNINKAFFYLKENKSDDNRKLIELKNRLIEKSKIDNNLYVTHYKDANDFKIKTINSFTQTLNELYPKDKKLSEIEKLRATHQIFAKSRQKNYIPHDKNEEILSKFINSDQDRLLLYGESGYGKSALIANYLNRFRADDNSYFIIEHYIGGAGELSNDLHQMLRRVMLEIKEEFNLADEIPTEPQKIMDEFALWVHRVKRPTIIVFDGYNQIEDELKEKLFYYIPEKLESVKLIISSIKDDYPIDNKYKIEPLTKKEQEELIVDYLKGYGKEGIALKIQNQISNHPQTDNTLFLRTLLNEIRLLGNFDNVETDIANYLQAKDVVELFMKIFERLESDYRENLAKEVLLLLYVSRDGLSEDNLMEIINQNTTKKLTRLEFSPLFLAVEEHLINRGGLYGFFHDYIREAVKNRYLSSDELVNEVRRKIIDYFEGREIDNQRVRELPFQLFALQDRDRLYSCLIDVEFFVSVQEVDEYELLEYVQFVDEIYPVSDELTNKLLTKEYNSETINNIGYFFHLTYTDYENALLLFKKMIKLDRNDSSIVINNYNNIGGLYATMGNYKRSFIMHKKALEHSIDFFGENHLDTAICYNSLAFIYESCEKFDEALIFYQKALKIREAILSKNHVQTAILYNNIAGIYSILAKYEEALKLYEKALFITTKTLGKNHFENSIHYNNIAWIHYTMGDYETALKEYNHSLDISINAVGENHTSTLQSYDNLASYYLAIGKYSKALSIFEDTLRKTKNIFGEEHVETAITMGNLATTYYNMEEYDKGIVLAKQALDISEKILGKDTHTTATKYNNLALFYSALEDYDKALELYKIALRISIKIRGEKHPDTAISYNNLAGVYESKEEYDVALPLYQKALEIYEDVFGEEHPDTAMLYNNLAYLYESMNKLEEALVLYEKAYKIKMIFFDEEHPDVVGVARNIKLVKENMGNLLYF